MRRFKYYLHYITLFLGALVLSTAATFVWNDKYWGNGVGSLGMCVNAGEGLAGLGGFSSYMFYDGTTLSFAETSFESAEAAEQCFQSQLEFASTILEREVLVDKAHEHIVGERVVVIFPADEYSQKEWASVISVDGSTIFEITSHSLRRSLNFEKKNRVY